MTEIDRIARLFDQVFDGSPYYGPALLAVLEGIDAAAAARQPDWSAHSIWALVNHLTAELRYALAVLEQTAQPWTAGQTTWPEQADFSAAAWQESLRALRQAHRALARAIRQLDDAVLEQKPHAVRGPYYAMLHGTLQHIIYHTGQISLLKPGALAPGDLSNL